MWRTEDGQVDVLIGGASGLVDDQVGDLAAVHALVRQSAAADLEAGLTGVGVGQHETGPETTNNNTNHQNNQHKHAEAILAWPEFHWRPTGHPILRKLKFKYFQI